MVWNTLIFSKFNLFIPWPVILLQIVMVSPGTYLVKNHESQSRTNESYNVVLKKNASKFENSSAFV